MALEAVTIEAILPGNIGLVIDCETDNRARTIQELRLVLKRHGGTASPCSFLFRRCGRIILKGAPVTTLDQVLEQGLEAGALDVEEGRDEEFVVETEPSDTSRVAEAISKALDMQILSSEVIWVSNEETLVHVPDAERSSNLIKLVEDLHENEPGIRDVYMNLAPGELDEQEWSDLRDKVNV